VKPSDYAAAIVAAVVWGLTFIAIKFGVEAAPPFL
jgi:drug/metabolite transporter (DMT)-like permease